MSYIFEKTQVLSADSPSVDAFGRYRTSDPVVRFDGRAGFTEDLQWSDQLISGTLTSSFNANTASVLFTTTANTAGRRVRQSMSRFNYTPGKSQLVMASFIMGSGVGGNKKKVGYFDDRNGIFFQQDGSEVSINRRTYVTGSAVDTKVVQSSWNLDTFDGTGPSGITLDLTKIQVLVIDFAWLGGGRIRVGFIVGGITYYCHEFLVANTISTVSMSTGSLPVRYEMEHSGTGPSSSMHCVCASVISEGDSRLVGSPGGRWSGVQTGLSATTAYGLLGIRLKAAQVHGPVVYVDRVTFSITTASDAGAWYLLRDPTLTGTFTYSGVNNTSVEVAAGNPTANLTNADIVTMGLITSGSMTDVDLSVYGVQLETEADGTPIPLVLTVYTASALDASAAVRWRQLG